MKKYFTSCSCMLGLLLKLENSKEVERGCYVQEYSGEAGKPSFTAADLRRGFIRNGLCAYCGGTFKGVFTKTCSKCGRNKNY